MSGCKYKLNSGQLCGLDAKDDGWCIGHSPALSKDKTEFDTCLVSLNQRFGNISDRLDGFVFPAGDYSVTNIVSKAAQFFALNNVTIQGNLTIDWYGPVLPSIVITESYIRGNLVIHNTKSESVLAVRLGNLEGDLILSSLQVQMCDFNIKRLRGLVTKGRVQIATNFTMNDSAFSEDAILGDFHVSGTTNFRNCRFGGKFDCSRAHFNSDLILEDSRFGAPNLMDAVFGRGLNLKNTNIGENSPNVLYQADINGKIDLRDADTAKLLVVVDKLEYLDALEMAGANWDMNQKYPLSLFGPKFWQFDKNLLDYNEQLRQMSMYRTKFKSDHRWNEERLFYIREKELMRRRERKFSLGYLLNVAYSFVSRYGESFLRPVLLLLLLWSAVSICMYCSGVNIRIGNQLIPLNADLTMNPSDGQPVLLDERFWNVFFLNFNLLLPNRPRIEEHTLAEWQRAMIGVETLMTVVLASFLIVALRRKYRRTYPSD